MSTMTETDVLIEQVEKNCKNRGKHLTNKRKLVFSALVQSKKALSAYELAEYCKTQFDQSIPAMTVYRILHFLQAEHLVHRLNVANKYIVCSQPLSQHEHGVPQFFICSQCNKIIEQLIDPKMVSGIQSDARENGFTVLSPQLEICCVCDECSKDVQNNNQTH